MPVGIQSNDNDGKAMTKTEMQLVIAKRLIGFWFAHVAYVYRTHVKVYSDLHFDRTFYGFLS